MALNGGLETVDQINAEVGNFVSNAFARCGLKTLFAHKDRWWIFAASPPSRRQVAHAMADYAGIAWTLNNKRPAQATRHMLSRRWSARGRALAPPTRRNRRVLLMMVVHLFVKLVMSVRRWQIKWLHKIKHMK